MKSEKRTVKNEKLKTKSEEEMSYYIIFRYISPSVKFAPRH